MKAGLTIVQTYARYWQVTRVGWWRRVEGDEWEMLPGSRLMLRAPGVGWVLDGLAHAAASGPGKRYQLGEAAPVGVPYHRLLIQPPFPCDDKAWAKHCPKPKGWDEALEAAR